MACSRGLGALIICRCDGDDLTLHDVTEIGWRDGKGGVDGDDSLDCWLQRRFPLSWATIVLGGGQIDEAP